MKGQKAQVKKTKRGRPSKYRPEYCDIVIAEMREGRSIAAVCEQIGVPRKTLLEWGKEHKEFRKACDLGRELAQKWWEKLAIGVATGEITNHPKYKKANGNMVQFMMSRRFTDYYAKNRQIIETDQDTSKDQIKSLSREELLHLANRYKMILQELEQDDDAD